MSSTVSHCMIRNMKRIAVATCNHCRLRYQAFSVLNCYHLNFKNYRMPIKICTADSHSLKANAALSFQKSTTPVNKYVWRSHTCGELSSNHIGESVRLCGWVDSKRLTMFILLRDSYGITQVFIPQDRQDLQALVENLPLESVISVTGEVQKRPDGNENPEMQTGEIEIRPTDIEVLNSARKALPIYNNDHNKSNEQLSMQYRYIALRRKDLQRNLRLRSRIISDMRNYLIKECHFVDIETPTLFRNTPGGAQEFVVPTQHPGLFYSLVQSPQQLKQLLMVGGSDRYFQIARCYRDETTRFDRQPEFTQLDIEMSFVDCHGVINLIEDLLMRCWPQELGHLTVPFKCMTYNDAMRLYGTDKPDLRIPYQLKNITKIIDASAIEQAFKIVMDNDYEIYTLTYPGYAKFLTNNVKRNLVQINREYYPNVKLICAKTPLKAQEGNQIDFLFSEIMKPDVSNKLNLSEGDAFFLAVGKKTEVEELLGRLRVKFADILENENVAIRSHGYEFLWITDFPLFFVNSTNGLLETMHHPFTQPHPDDIKYLSSQPEMVRGLHYDLVVNGAEIGGGSIRIHDANLQREILKMLNINCDSLDYMLNALECGAPPHGGIALGLDRLMSIICNERSIKNVIAFPKTMEGRDPLSNAPSTITDEDKRLYHLNININKCSPGST